jgi:hypothetical protein
MASIAKARRLKDELQVVLDVDGVTRHGVTDTADPRIIRLVKALLERAAQSGVVTRVAFVSGTPSIGPAAPVPDWRSGNAPLSEVFGTHFVEEMRDGRVEIYGQLGADRLLVAPASDDGANIPQLMGRVDKGFTHVVQVDILAELINHYHRDLQASSDAAFSAVAPLADKCLKLARESAKEKDAAAGLGQGPLFCTGVPEEMEEYVLAVRREFDPEFRLVSNGASIEYHDFASVMKAPHTDMKVPGGRGFPTSGIAHREGRPFRFVLITYTNKGATVGKIVDDRRKEIALRRGGDPAEHELEVVTIGDTAIDYPMHAVASTPFHVGIPAVWDAHDSAEMAHVALVTGKDGAAPQVDGTVSVLEALVESITNDGTNRGLNMERVKELMSPRLMLRETIID